MENIEKSSPVLAALLEAARFARARFDIRIPKFRVVLAVSGGEDSCVLLDGFKLLAEKAGLELIVAHFDHALRPESAQDAEFVRALAEKHSLPFFIERAGADGINHLPHGENVEAWARRVRYAFLQRVLETTNAHAVATAHHQNDQAETVLSRMLSGRFLTSLHSIARVDTSRRIFRPLLDCTKEDLQAYCIEKNLAFVQDSTNQSFERLRNQIRHELLPQLQQQYNPSLVPTLSLLSARLSEDENELWARAEEKLAGMEDASPSAFAQLSPALCWRALSVLARDSLGEEASKLGYRNLLVLAEHVQLPVAGVKHFHLGFGIGCEISRESVRFYMSNGLQATDIAAGNCALGFVPIPLPVPGAVERKYADGSVGLVSTRLLELQGDIKLEIQNLLARRSEALWRSEALRCSDELSDGPKYLRDCEYFDANEILAGELLIRERREGDEMRVWGRGRRKLKKLFSERRLRLTLRDEVPIVESCGRILWVPGVARSEFAPVSADSRRVVEFRYSRT